MKAQWRNRFLANKTASTMEAILHYENFSYFTLNRIIANVNSASDSINARPSTRNRKIPGRAPGFRAIASQEEATARPCPRPQRPEAMAIEIPAAIATMLAWESEDPADCAKAGTAMHKTESVIKAFCIVRIF